MQFKQQDRFYESVSANCSSWLRRKQGERPFEVARLEMRSRKSPTSVAAEETIGRTQDAIKIGVHFAPLQTVAEAHRPVAGSASGSRSAADRRKREQSAFHFHTEEPELHPGRSHFGLRLNQLPL